MGIKKKNSQSPILAQLVISVDNNDRKDKYTWEESICEGQPVLGIIVQGQK